MHGLPLVEIAGLAFMLQDSIDGPDGTRAFLRPALCHISNYSFYRFQMTLGNCSVFEST